MGENLKFRSASKIIFLFGFLLAFLTFKVISDNQKSQWEKEFFHHIQRYMLLFKGELEANERILLSVQSFFHATHNVEREEFKAYVDPILANNKYIKGLEWIPRISDENRKAFETNMRNKGFPSTQITERKKQGKMIRAGSRSEYFPVFFFR